MKFFPRKNIFLHPKSEPEKSARQREATSDQCEGERERNVMCIKHHVVYFLQSIVVSGLAMFLAFFRVCTHSRNMAHFFSEIMFTHPMEILSLFCSLLLPSLRACVWMCKYFKFAHTYAPCVQLEIYQAYDEAFRSQLPFCFAFVLLSSNSFFPFFRLLIYYVPKKNCYRWEAYLIFFGLAIYSMSYHEICLIPDFFNDCSKGFLFMLPSCRGLKWTCNAWLSSEGSGESSVVAPFFIIERFFLRVYQVAKNARTRQGVQMNWLILC